MQTFSTKDIGLATAVLTSLSLPFPRIESDGRLCTFEFSIDEQQARPVVDSFYNRQLQVDALSFEQTRQALVTQMHQAKQG